MANHLNFYYWINSLPPCYNWIFPISCYRDTYDNEDNFNFSLSVRGTTFWVLSISYFTFMGTIEILSTASWQNVCHSGYQCTKRWLTLFPLWSFIQIDISPALLTFSVKLIRIGLTLFVNIFQKIGNSLLFFWQSANQKRTFLKKCQWRPSCWHSIYCWKSSQRYM
jgi:hypothetical protein